VFLSAPWSASSLPRGKEEEGIERRKKGKGGGEGGGGSVNPPFLYWNLEATKKGRGVRGKGRFFSDHPIAFTFLVTLRKVFTR